MLSARGGVLPERTTQHRCWVRTAASYRVCARLLRVSISWERKPLTAGFPSRKGCGGVFARVSTFEGPREQVDELVHAAVEKALPQLKRFAGFKGAWP